MKSGLCSYENIGKFIFGTEDPNDHTLITQTSFWTANVALNEAGVAESNSPSFWDDPQGNPTPPSDDNTSPWSQRGVAPVAVHVTPRDTDPLNPSPSGTLVYTSPIQYQLRKTGYYCVGKLFFSDMMTVALYPFPTAIVPVTVMTPTARQAPFHSTYNGVVLFSNTFDGKLPATDYPKVTVSSSSYFHGHTCRPPIVLPLDVFCICTIWFSLGVCLLQASYGTPTYSGALSHQKGILISLSHVCYAVLFIRADRVSCHRDGSKLG